MAGYLAGPTAQWRHAAGSSAMLSSAAKDLAISAGSAARHTGHVAGTPCTAALARSLAKQQGEGSPPLTAESA